MIDFSGLPPLIPEDTVPDTDPAILASVCEAIRGYCGWHIAPAVTQTFTIDYSGNRLVQLPTLHMTAVESVVDADGQPIAGYTWSELGALRRASWPQGFRAITATITHGLDAVPPAIISVAGDMIADLVAAAEGPSVSRVSLDSATADFAAPSTDVGVRRRIQYAYGHILGRYKL
ncbi:hypothetical protein MYK68_15910 [Gordonia sp. PP30]|uniref:hypothetical protein n=1 Tax=Gordonia sp. PP30 TaxID=2935861 RepID=UPI001FFF0B8B|nr:hypothetical protein [Gordonia sp. PP30]UQE74196.1 hypothetical protein MYK68_15910 [Gordonia sp. PP30]